MDATLREKPRQGFAGLWNISFGFFGIQIGFVLQNSNMSRIFQTLGASMDDLPALWVAAPLTGLIVQPIIGHLSDKTWNSFGGGVPTFVTGAILAAISLVADAAGPAICCAAAVRRRIAVGARCKPEHRDGAVPSLCWRHARPTRSMRQAMPYRPPSSAQAQCVAAIFPWLLEQVGVSNVAAGR